MLEIVLVADLGRVVTKHLPCFAHKRWEEGESADASEQVKHDGIDFNTLWKGDSAGKVSNLGLIRESTRNMVWRRRRVEICHLSHRLASTVCISSKDFYKGVRARATAVILDRVLRGFHTQRCQDRDRGPRQ